MREVRIVPDAEADIVEAVNALRARYDHVFTTGGIGPTHDDITSASIAKALDVPYGRHPEAERRLLAYYPPEKVNPARMKMAETPEGAELIDNPVSVAPGFTIGNVHVLPGVPSILQAMFAGLKPRLKGGAVVRSTHDHPALPRGRDRQAARRDPGRHPTVEIGSYPFMRQEQLRHQPRPAQHRRGRDRGGGQRDLAESRERGIEILDLF